MRVVAGLACFAVACSGHSSGGDPPVDAPASSYVLDSLTDACDGHANITGQDALAMVMPSYTATFSPLHGGAPSTLMQTVVYDAGTITCHPAQSNIEVSMNATLDLAVHATIATSDGMFDESFFGTVTLADGVPDALGFDGTVAIADLHGTFVPMIHGSFQSHDVDFGGTLTAAGSTSGVADEQASNVSFGETGAVGGWQ